ncbi:hypothetical protein L198_06633 [Cryptococcus wingfieldii CBS 7118]|uniref:Major facilitator superfamily (MFS) profile domain-containing protein n=1 Tax=Cryptococcus wingfieldii CBS 7118 TaxID=1295528 RepID=A0A1E3IM99_9TREE|nr:hypothetical protein L198_06633 [Cryptococcus wingfieldii CBS 7118]ODN88831.1 hypothetical protein L198_06633 [Cryptococcus wingfieldii CBS 7118]
MLIERSKTPMFIVSFLSELETLTPAGTYGLYLGFSTVFFIFIIFFYPETKQLSIDETSMLFEDDWGVARSRRMRRERDETRRRFADAEMAEVAEATLEARQDKHRGISASELKDFMSGLKNGRK